MLASNSHLKPYFVTENYQGNGKENDFILSDLP